MAPAVIKVSPAESYEAEESVLVASTLVPTDQLPGV
jgi:hypothetical protein